MPKPKANKNNSGEITDANKFLKNLDLKINNSLK
jgi:hypothetical protein